MLVVSVTYQSVVEAFSSEKLAAAWVKKMGFANEDVNKRIGRTVTINMLVVSVTYQSVVEAFSSEKLAAAWVKKMGFANEDVNKRIGRTVTIKK